LPWRRSLRCGRPTAPRGSPSARYWSACVRSCCRRSSTTRPQKIGFVDDKWFLAGGGRGIAEADESAIYLAIPLRNVGSGIAVLHGWTFFTTEELGTILDTPPRPLRFVRLTRDLYVPVGDVGFWQGTFRNPRRLSSQRRVRGSSGVCPDRRPALRRPTRVASG
jgi:hypothetical protein